MNNLFKTIFLLLLITLMGCTSEQSEVIVEVGTKGLFFDVRSDLVLAEGSVSAANLFSLQGSKVVVNDISITQYGHAVFSTSTSGSESVSLSDAIVSDDDPEGNSTSFLSEIQGLSPQTTYYLRTYAQYEGQPSPKFSEERAFSISEIQAVNYWQQEPIVFEGEIRTAPISFGMGNQAFIGTGFKTSNSVENNNLKDFWRYSTRTESWDLLNSVPQNFEGRSNATVFTIDNSAYIGLGIQTLGTALRPSYRSLDDFWKYTPSQDSWERVAPYPGQGTRAQVAVTIGNKAYVGLGGVFGGGSPTSLTGELFEYNASNNTWTAKASFPGKLRSGGVAFAIGNKIYFGMGASRIDGISVGDGFEYLFDFYEFDVEANSWRQLSDVPIQLRRAYAGGFAVGGKGYVVAGRRSLLNSEIFDDVLTYDPESDSWQQLEDMPGGVGYNNLVAVLSDRIMIGLGTDGLGILNSEKELFFYYPYIPSN